MIMSADKTDFLPDDDGWTLDVSPDETYWNQLIEEIIEGNVVPVVGAEMLVENCPNIHKEIVGALAKKLGVTGNVMSFSELVFHRDYRPKADSIYLYVSSYLKQKPLVPSQLLKKLLSFRQLPFVITTSFTPVVENAMRDIWGSDLRVLRFGNNPSNNGDIRDEADLRCPTVYYMFGKYCDSPRRFALTDTDMLDYCSSWLSDTLGRKPVNLASALAGKYLLMIGNNYSDWLFRFIWYSLRKDKMGQGMVAYDDVDDSFLHFLSRTNAFARQNPAEVVDQIEKRLERRMQENEDAKFSKPENNADIFISYSRRDAEVAEKLYAAFTRLGKKVWYDRNNLSLGSHFMEEINQSIRTARYFVPVLSKNITEERNAPHVYRREWDTAIDVAISLGRTYIIPLAPEDFDYIEAQVPERLRQHNAVIYNGNTDWDELAREVLHVMNKY